MLAVAFIYMVLASQFNSFVHPLTIMTSLPLSLPAGLLALMAFGMTINVYSAIGLMMLFGIVKKNSILQVDYTNTLREQGMERHEALIAANHVRLRPILMTTIAIVAGMIPIALGRGAGAGSRASMAITILGGQVLCLLLTLLVTPVVYLVLRRPARVEPDARSAALAAEDRPRRRSRRRSDSESAIGESAIRRSAIGSQADSDVRRCCNREGRPRSTIALVLRLAFYSAARFFPPSVPGTGGSCRTWRSPRCAYCRAGPRTVRASRSARESRGAAPTDS